MELNIHIPDNTAALFDCLQKGQFISSNSCNEAVRDMYDQIDDHFEALSVYFAQIGYTLERGNEYFYFSRVEPRTTLEQKSCVPTTGLTCSTCSRLTMRLSARDSASSPNRFWWRPTST